MTSTVLARKYRPRSFEAMVGQGHVVQALANALTQQRLHHAYLFTGTRGVGKTTVSRILAKSLNCVGTDGQGGITATPCGQCQPCRDIDAGRFVDYVELDAASNRGVDEISQLLDQAVYKPVVGRFKVYMIDEVHMLSNTAFNAMLKTLEEPPEYLKFVLATTDPQKVPVTVLSRCLQFNLRPMALQTVHEHLEQVLTQEGVGFDPGALRLLARAARGSMRDGLSLTDQAIAYGGGVLEESVVRQMLGSVDRQHVVRILEAVVGGDGAGLVHAVDGLRKLGLSAQGTLDELAAALQHMALIQSVPGLSEGDEEMATWQSLADRYAPDETQLFYSLALHGRQELPLAPDEYAGLLMLLLRWLAFKPGASSPKAEGPAAHVASGLSRQDGSSGRSHHAVSMVAAGTQPAAPVTTRQLVPEAAVPAPVVASVKPVAPAVAATDALPPAPAPVPVPVPHRPSASPDPRPEPPPWDDDAASCAMPADAMTFEDLGELPATTQAIPRARAVEREAPAPSPVHEQERVSVREHPMASGRSSGITATVVPVVPTTALGDRWADVVARLQQEGLITALVRELAMQGECVDVQDEPGLTVWRLRVERESLRGEAQRDRLAAALQKALGGEVRIELEAGVARDTPALRDQAARAGRQAAAEALIKQDPLVNSLLEQYPGARVVAGSISPL